MKGLCTIIINSFLLWGSAKSMRIPPVCEVGVEQSRLSCNSTQIFCKKGYSPSSGCSLGDYCYDMKDPCEKTCPCMEDEVSCVVSYGKSGMPALGEYTSPCPFDEPFIDSYTNRPARLTCIPKESVNSMGHTCPNFCPTMCRDGYKVCPFTVNEKGCYQARTCSMKLEDCPLSIYDHKGCQLKEHKKKCELCPKVFDENGCEGEDVCAEGDSGKCPVSEYDEDGCPVLDPVSCAEDEDDCYSGYDKKGCRTRYTCQKYFGESYCINHCPTICEEESEKVCSQGFDFNGCPNRDKCIRKRSTRVFAGRQTVNCSNHCRPPCNLSNHKLCPQTFDSNGCPQEETCVPRERECPTSKYDENACLIPQPIKCDEQNEFISNGGTDSNGCKLQDKCIPRRVGNCSQTHPVECDSNMITCSSGIDENGCSRPDTCVPKKLSGFNNCSGICPSICAKDQLKCQDVHELGMHHGKFLQKKLCVINEFCIDTVNKETNCTNFCPSSCIEEYQLCEGPLDSNGCPLKGFCIPKTTYGLKKNLCPLHCPISCPEGERLCPGAIGFDTCREPPQCFSKEQKCPQGNRDYYGCEIVSKLTACEDKDTQICPGVRDENGCKGPATCVDARKPCPISEYNSSGCPVFDPDQCDWSNEKLCRTQWDGEKKCPPPGKCIEIMRDNCEQFCDPHCYYTSRLCSGGQDANGCPLSKFCYPKDQICPETDPNSDANSDYFRPQITAPQYDQFFKAVKYPL